MIEIKKQGNDYLVRVKYPKKQNLKDLKLKFDLWSKLEYWLEKELKRIFKEIEPKTIEEIRNGFF